MSQTAEYFEKNGYVILQGALSEEKCNELTKHMFDLFEQGKLTKDSQCPLSDSIYGDPVFDTLLQEFANPLGIAIGKKLLPTYTYARIYRHGEVLEKHKDRPACEISATLTLGYDSKPIWPIFFDEEKEIAASLDIGELALYKGCEIQHWRPEFKGKWHVQVFFHYVDADGPYKNEVMDGRPAFGIQKGQKLIPNETKEKEIENSENNKFNVRFIRPIFNSIIIPKCEVVFPGYFIIDKNNLPELMFTKEECEKIINLSKINYSASASIGGQSENQKIVKEIRSANIYTLDNNDENYWIYEKVASVVSIVNQAYFDYDISGITHALQLIHYSSKDEVKGHYDWHVDAGNGEPVYRKISLTVQLSDPDDYEGCELIINNHAHNVTGTKERGSIHMFPSYMPHKVTSITKGDRYALVIWVHGPKRFR